MKNLFKYLVLLSSLLMGKAYADNSATLIGTSVVTTYNTNTVKERVELEGRHPEIRTTSVEKSTSKNAVMALSDGTMYFISFFGIVTRSYAAILADWNADDEITVEYVGGVKAPVNPYKITNVSRGEEIWGKKLESL